jgi:Domain of unknown function (DUF5655)
VASLSPEPTIAQHFVGRAAAVRATYDRLVRVAESFGAVRQEPKKTSIHLTSRTAFAGIATRRDTLILTIKSAVDIDSPRIIRHDQASSRRWYLEIRLDKPEQVDRELKTWLKRSADLSR